MLQVAGWVTVAVIAATAGGAAGGVAAHWKLDQSLGRAQRHVQRHEWAAAAVALRSVLKVRPNAAEVRFRLADVLRLDQPELALQELRLVPETSPEFLPSARIVAAINLQLGRDYDAIEPLHLLRHSFPGDVGVCQALAEVEFRAGNFEASLKLARNARTLDPGNVSCCLLEADACDNLQRTEEMIAPLRAALNLDQNLSQAHLNLAYALERSGEAAAAFPHVKWFLERHPESVAGLRVRATIEQRLGNFEAGLQSIRSALTYAPEQLECRLVEAELLLSSNRPSEAYHRLMELDEVWGFEPRYLKLAVRAASDAGLSGSAGELQSRWSKTTP